MCKSLRPWISERGTEKKRRKQSRIDRRELKRRKDARAAAAKKKRARHAETSKTRARSAAKGAYSFRDTVRTGPAGLPPKDKDKPGGKTLLGT
jgi:hypothetical protein